MARHVRQTRCGTLDDVPLASTLSTYRDVARIPGITSLLILGFIARVPTFALPVLLTVHVTASLHQPFAVAGMVALVGTVALAIAAPLWGRCLDRYPLRTVLAPLLVVSAAVWVWVPWAGLTALVGLVLVGGFASVPYFSLVRQALLARVAPDQRRIVISLDSVLVELSFAIGPAVGIVATTMWPTGWVLLGAQAATLAAGLGWFLLKPELRSIGMSSTSAPDTAKTTLWSTSLAAVLGVAMAATVVLAGTDITLVRIFSGEERRGELALAMVVWSLGSAVGGLLYGALHRTIAPAWLQCALVVVTAPLMVANSAAMVMVLITVAGLLCAPTIVATVDAVASQVSDARRGEALGWHGSMMTVGGALGPPLAGIGIDRGGVTWGIALVCLAGLVLTVPALVPGISAYRRRHAKVHD